MAIFNRFKLTGKRLFITGGSRGLGREMALAIADAGADVILVGRDPPSLEKTAGDIRALGRQAWTIAADVGNDVKNAGEKVKNTDVDVKVDTNTQDNKH